MYPAQLRAFLFLCFFNAKLQQMSMFRKNNVLDITRAHAHVHDETDSNNNSGTVMGF